jgi:hypothetical protein
LVITPIGGLILLLILPNRERGAVAQLTNALDGLSGKMNVWSDKLNKKAGEMKAVRQAEAARIAELDTKIEAEARDERVGRLIAEHMSELAKAPVPNMAALGSTTGSAAFGKRR